MPSPEPLIPGHLASAAHGPPPHVVLPRQPCGLAVSPLLREAVLRLGAQAPGGSVEAPEPARQRIAAVVLDELAQAQQVALGLAMPRDRRLLRVAQALRDAPQDARGLREWAALAAMSPRNLSRSFVQQTGLSYTAWRQRLRMMRALEMLAAGQPVTAVALDLGWSNVSAFITLFRRCFGTTPGRHAEAGAAASVSERDPGRSS